MLGARRQHRPNRLPHGVCGLNEIAAVTDGGIEIDEAAIPVAPPVAHACELLGLDPLQVANEGKLLAVVPAAAAERVLAGMRADAQGRAATILGR